MSFQRLGALIAVLAIAGFPLSSQAADQAAAMPGTSGPLIDAQAQIDALKDIPPNSWAYQSIVDLYRDGIIIGYPDGTFKGSRPLTRYEAAVMVERAVQFLTKQLADVKTAQLVQQKDIDTLRALLDEFRGDIDSLKIRVGDIDARLKTVETNQKTDESAAKTAPATGTTSCDCISTERSTNSSPTTSGSKTSTTGMPLTRFKPAR